MLVTVKYYTMLREAVGVKSEIIETDHETKVEEVLFSVYERIGGRWHGKSLSFTDFVKNILVFINDRQISDIKTKLTQNDILSLFTSISGG